MSAGKQTSFEGTIIQNFNFFLEHTEEHKVMLQHLPGILRPEFERIGAGKSSLDVLGVGSGAGDMDAEMLSLLQSVFPAVPITADIVDGSIQLTDSFKALVANTANLQKISFAWHIMNSEDYEKQVKAQEDMKKFDFIHMIHVLYYVENLNEALKFHHSLLKRNGRLLIIVNAATSDWVPLWKAYMKELRAGTDIDKPKMTSGEVIACLKSQGLKYDEYVIPISFDITECFNPGSTTGERLLSFMTSRPHFSQSFTPDIRAGILDLLRNKCSTMKDGRVFFNSTSSCIIVHA
ncbi:histamine N-methyltransferase A-like [Salarias fasciatus]|uniref:Histamine N-methyltransferase A-like n=1 Tax=Salarias fasciatus TaxID=181472 RepID=A0A672IQB6_SALFA|nr:histamine N-methyltransferase A-like [Salarias fasciatus]